MRSLLCVLRRLEYGIGNSEVLKRHLVSKCYRLSCTMMVAACRTLRDARCSTVCLGTPGLQGVPTVQGALSTGRARGGGRDRWTQSQRLWQYILQCIAVI